MSVGPKGKPAEGQTTKRIRALLLPALLAALFLAYAALRWSSAAPAFERARQVSDTPAYLRVAGLPLTDPDFWLNARPFVFPLAVKALRGDLPAVARFQTVFSILCWGLLALAASSAMKYAALRPLTFGLLLALSLDRHIAGWDLVMLTESLALSLLALFVAGWLWLLKGWRWWKAIVLILISFLWAFCRDTNAWLLLMLSGLILLAVFFFKANRRFLALALVFALFFALGNFAAGKGDRWVFPFQNVLAERILTDAGALAFFSDCGMPVTPELLQLVEGHAGSAERAFYEDPALEPYRAWLHADGKSCYVRWLLSVPGQSLRQPLADFEPLVRFERVDRFFPQPYQPLLPGYLERLLYPRDALPWLWALTGLASLAAIGLRAWKTNPAWSVFIALNLLVYPHLFIVWHGDTSGIDRHALSLAVQFVLSGWLLLFLLLEKGLDQLSGWAGSRSSGKNDTTSWHLAGL
ncbi:MAG: hypothetical protein ACOYYU_17240 [Chloroflexota bacterium]